MPPIDDPLVSTDWLSARIDDPKVKIIDASFKMPGVLPLPLDDYLGAHIPGAVFFDVDAIADHNDARPRPRFEVAVAEPWPGRRSGHIPGSRNVPYAELFDARTGAMKPLDDLRKAFTGADVDLTKPIVTTCGSGVSALVLTLALYRLGARGTALYDCSCAEWGLPDGPPVATGPR